MGSWRDALLESFIPGLSRLTLVADPDGLLLEERVAQAIRSRGFEVLTFETPVEFRYVYESVYRSRWDRGDQVEVVVRASSQDLRSLPYDLLETGRKLTLSLAALFPQLSYPVVAELERSDLDALYSAQQRSRPPRLGEDETKDYILAHVFGIVPGSIAQPADLLRHLLRWHYQHLRVPTALANRVVDVLKTDHRFDDWPLDEIVPDRAAFFSFLQERWPIYLDRLTSAGEKTFCEQRPVYALRYPGAADLPFGHEDVRFYVDNLFVEGLLQPVAYPLAGSLGAEWARVGVVTQSADRPAQRFARVLDNVEGSLPEPDARHREWLTFGCRWAEAVALRYASTVLASAGPDLLRRFSATQKQLDSRFSSWIEQRFAGLHSQPPFPPVMLHHVPRAISEGLSSGSGGKGALVVLDGLSLDQWVVLRDAIAAKLSGLRVHEDAVFAWVPTITPVSRQALFAGRAPVFFPESIDRTDRDAARWTQFWTGQGLNQEEIAYAASLRDEPDLRRAYELASHPKHRVVGLVVDKVDRISHGMQLGTAGMHSQLRQWADAGFLAALLDLLVQRGFVVWLTSDHGNVEAVGYSSPAEGSVAEVRGERVRVYPDETLRARVAARFPGAVEWPAVGLPPK